MQGCCIQQAGSLHIDRLGERVITYRYTRVQGYYIQIDKGAGLLHTDRQGARTLHTVRQEGKGTTDRKTRKLGYFTQLDMKAVIIYNVIMSQV